MQGEQVTKINSQHMEEVCQKCDVQSLSLFISVARGESGPDSDLDILVTYSHSPGSFNYLDIKDYLEGLSNLSVDLVTMKARKNANFAIKSSERLLGWKSRIEDIWEAFNCVQEYFTGSIFPNGNKQFLTLTCIRET